MASQMDLNETFTGTPEKVIYERGSFRKVCDGAKHFAQLLQEGGKWGEDHDVDLCDCPKEKV